MTRRRNDPVEDDATARLVLAATGAVLGASIEAILSIAGTHAPELCLVRHVAAVALGDAGWSRNRIVRHLHVDRATIAKDGIADRLRANVPALVAAATAAVAEAISRAPDKRIEVDAREVMRQECKVAGVAMRFAATSKSKAARDIRARVARRLYAHQYDGVQIAKVLGYNDTTVYRWLAVDNTRPGPSRASAVSGSNAAHIRTPSPSTVAL